MKNFKVNCRDTSGNVVVSHGLLATNLEEAESKLPLLLESCRLDEVVAMDVENI